ncbi:hypothetical protein K9N68_26125 [Kovacikia minuta CCNUW1]|uniref:hypothetical protein n=1 Tax=Kovacikia minuta TaxID=2931930 RepID=UPI001CCD6311|nr:hypothetical protein [Kovacikia minuta]UBF25081.1 hypothetical protein K9N68_26125 [Kovacikia minuta CCNUW1]
MSCLNHPYKSLGWLLIPALLTTPVLAHTIKVGGDVAATFHIEPNHNPIAGKPSLAWFALTRKGGKLIPLSQCNCQLEVRPVPQTKGVPVLKPALKTVNVEKYKGVIGAMVTFPKAGRYEMELRGTAKSPATFQPFKLSYTVTVGG